MERIYLFGNEGEFFKANLHCHTSVSDGKLSPEEVKEAYIKEGYSVVAYSDHNKLISYMHLADENFIPITAIEIDITDRTKQWPAYSTYHLNFYSKDPNLEDFVEVDRSCTIENINDLIKRAKEKGFLAQYNHPRWSFQTPADFLPLEGLFAFEVFNTGCEMEMFDGWGDYEYEVYSRAMNKCGPVATDDNHNGAPLGTPMSDSFKGFTLIKAKELTYDSIFGALENLNFYASTGPIIEDIYIEDNKVYIKSSPVSGVVLRTDTRESRTLRDHDDLITEAVFDLNMTFPYEYIRFELINTKGQKAMTRAYFKDEIGK